MLLSDQLLTWSDENIETDHRRLAKAPPSAPAPIAPAPSRPRGSLIERYKRCGKPACKCADGPGHGPKYYLSVSFPGLRPQMDYVPQESYAQASEFLANYHHARQILEEICEINRELLRRREKL
jgi:hypothetical protein